MVSRLSSSRNGNVALMFALLAPLLLACVGAGVDFARYTSIQTELQEAADRAALAGAHQFLLKKTDAATPKAVAEASMASSLSEDANLSAAHYAARADSTAATVDVDIDYAMQPTFLVGIFKSPIDIAVSASAQAGGSANICVLGTDPNASRTVYLDKNARLSGDDCAVFSNSKNVKGLSVLKSAAIESALICSAGGYEGEGHNFSPQPLVDCPVKSDPLASRQPPSFSGCDHTKFEVTSGVTTLFPGVYCGGLKIDNDANVTFASGVYVIDDGELRIDGNAKAIGDGVGFYFTGGGAKMTIAGDADVEFTAPLTGPLAGLLFFEDPNGNGARLFRITTPNARRLVGTIYLPNGRFLADASGAVADESEYTAIVARRIELNSDVRLVLNADYDLTPVPVPGGIKGAGAIVMLRQ